MRKRYIPIVILLTPLIILVGVALRIDAPFQFLFRYTIQPFQAWIFDRSQYTEPVQIEMSPEAVRALEEENIQLKVENAQLRTYVQESGVIQEQVDFLSLQGLRSIQARIVSRSLEGVGDVFVLNKGQVDGVLEGLAVIVGSGVVVGIIDSVNDTTSSIRLLSDSATQLSAVIQNEQKSQGVIVGSHQLSLSMQFIPLSDEVSVGNTVVTSGIDRFIPRGLVVGSVTAVTKQTNELFQSATVESLFLPQQLSVVSIVLP